ncbi:hypothetical protein PL75_11340, partial [Neisseria arctica]
AFASYDDLLAAAFFNNWSSDTLAISSIRKSFSAVRGYSDIANYQTFTGLHVANCELEIPEEGLVTVTVGMAGLNRSQAN